MFDALFFILLSVFFGTCAVIILKYEVSVNFMHCLCLIACLILQTSLIFEVDKSIISPYTLGLNALVVIFWFFFSLVAGKKDDWEEGGSYTRCYIRIIDYFLGLMLLINIVAIVQLFLHLPKG